MQFACQEQVERQLAVKFFLDSSLFLTEASLHRQYFPALRMHLSRVTQSALECYTSREQSESRKIAGARHLLHAEAVCDSAEAGLVHPRRNALPPCIVMERGESLQEWVERAELDRYTAFAVRTDLLTSQNLQAN